MATWGEVQEHMRTRFRLLKDEPEVIAMAWQYDDGRSQRVIVRRFFWNDVEMVEFKSPFGELGGVDPVELLRENARMAFGFVALSGEVFLVVHNVELVGLDLGRFDQLLSAVARVADQLERQHVEQDRF
jgi:hypothetical protein